MELFIPHNITELYEKMLQEQFMGQISLEGDLLIWILPNGMIVKAAVHQRFPEGYIETCYLNKKKEIQLTHWHPAEEEIYKDLQEINMGQTFWVKKKKAILKNIPLIMDKDKWEKYSEKRKSKYYIL